MLDLGLSPLTRGNLHRDARGRPRPGPIPAHAGQPRQLSRLRAFSRAYPRSRGATSMEPRTPKGTVGLSPLTRGNQQHCGSDRAGAGPIPAHAGQPGSVRSPSDRRGAYPRSRGATRSRSAVISAVLGLSPLTRGNRPSWRADRFGSGPIPAHAGQPSTTSGARRLMWAYPRSRGATGAVVGNRHVRRGLSPLTRGNLGLPSAVRERRGPIPAHAGQPRPARHAHLRCRAYPRSRGATAVRVRERGRFRGLSPLTRGNLRVGGESSVQVGPIPAHAGQPSRWTRTTRSTRAYPRSRGATVRVSM